MRRTHLHVFPQLLHEHLLVLIVDVDLLPVVDEVVVLVGGQLLGLSIWVRRTEPHDQINNQHDTDHRTPPRAADRQEQQNRADGEGEGVLGIIIIVTDEGPR